MRNQQSTTTSPYHEKLQNAEERAERSKDAVSSAQKLKHETKLAQMEAEAVVAESATDPFSPQSIRKKVRDVRLALNRARQEKEEAARELVWALEQEEEAKMFRLDLQKKVDDATEMVAVEEAKLEEMESSTCTASCLLQSRSPQTTPRKTNSSKSKAHSEAMVKLERAKADHEASKENLQRASAELRDAQKKLDAERAADEAYVSADTSRAGRAGARAARKEHVFLTPSRPGSKRDRKNNKSTPKSLPKRSKMLDAANQKESKNSISNVVSAEDGAFPFQVEIVAAVLTIVLVSLMLALDKHVLAEVANLLAVYFTVVLDSIVIFFTQLGDYTTHQTTSATNAASVALHNATFATKRLGRQALSEALGISVMLKGNILSAASSAVDLKDTVVDTTCAALQGLGK
eukprot:CAMPEP_0116023980 /NCGR_PEP_ID=MMETSP0321-20121206/12001_1 /TAXON_ID=163516 /ORGANISM="Leptocylindrus danicus var. danicus, Strain B650" /LENGTH=404 /DNA_ID=CAMNT_0003495537 /DNA_START=108 /DNA_END=1323 /DNA_ORIENTATION=-